MSNTNIGWRSFGSLALVAAGGLVVGSREAMAQGAAKPDLGVDPSLLLAEPHTCKGLNTVRAKGKASTNAQVKVLVRQLPSTTALD